MSKGTEKWGSRHTDCSGLQHVSDQPAQDIDRNAYIVAALFYGEHRNLVEK